MSPRGRLIVLEGGEGAGKTTQCAFIQAWLERRGRRVIRTREPGGSPLAEAIRQLVLGDWAEGVSPQTELLLIFAARAAHLNGTLLPALEAGTDVICDRFLDASYAYQGWGRGLPQSHLDQLAAMTLGDFRPECVILLDLPAEQGLARARARGHNNRFEEAGLDFMRRVRQGYLARAAADPRRYHRIAADRPQDEVSEAIAKVLETLA